VGRGRRGGLGWDAKVSFGEEGGGCGLGAHVGAGGLESWQERGEEG
jgi:hypothetical protein